MKPHIIPTAAVVLFVLMLAGCETDGGIAARTKEKSATYATLKQWEKNYIAKGIPSVGFTPDMVYMAMGHPTKIEPKDDPEGRKGELWTYSRYYPNLTASEVQSAKFNPESPYQPLPPTMQTAGGAYPNGPNVPQIPRGMSQIPESIAKTGGPQGGSMEPADLPSYTFYILFLEGKVLKIGAEQNLN